LKIALTSWAPFYAGAEVAALRLAVGLAEAGHEVACAVGTDGELLCKLREAGIPAEFIPTRFTDKWGWWSYRTSRHQMVQWLGRVAPDVVHSNDLPTHQMTSDAARAWQLPRVCHHRWIFERGAIDWFNKFGAERHLFVSRALMGDLCGASPRLAASPCEVVYDGLPLPKCPTEADRPAAKQALGLAADRSLVLFAGQIIERKGVADTLHAWAELSSSWAGLAPHGGGRANLVIVGDDLEGKGAYRAKMESLATELGSSARFVGFQKNVPTWLAAADIVLVPSHAEPLGNATLEAMAHARPVIGGDVGGIPEMVVDGETGLLVPPKSPRDLAAAIDRLLADPALANRLGAAARERCERLFSLEAHVAAVVRQYETVLASVREPAGVGA
jgi:glycosyltransferase involved in cell wall biosynthesis